MALRVKWLTTERTPKVDTRDITVITFTTEAARNMRKRMNDKAIGVPPNLQPRAMTMHALGMDVLTNHATEAGLSQDFRVLPRDGIRAPLLRDAGLMAGLDLQTAELQAKRAGSCRNQGDCKDDGSDRCKVCKQYIAILRGNNMIDHDDQMGLAVEVLSKCKPIRDEYRSRAQHLLVDEYQDINKAQHDLITILSQKQEAGLFVVGDDDQSIYEFRGGSLRFMKEFSQVHGAGSVRPKTHSFRCPGHILSGALSVASKYNTGRIGPGPKPQMTWNDAGEPIKVHLFPTQECEASEVATLSRDRSRKMDVLILVKDKFFAMPISRALRTRGVDHTFPFSPSGTALDSFSVIDAWAEDPDDSLALRHCIELILNAGVLEIPTRRARSAASLKERESSLRPIARLWDGVLRGRGSLWDVLRDESEKTAELRPIRDTLEGLYYARRSNAATYLAMLQWAFNPWGSRVRNMCSEFGEWVALARSASSIPSVRIMTMQGAKGLEADCVFVVGVDDGVLPSAVPNSAEEAAQSRLFFVSMSRAKRELHLCHSSNRSGGVSQKKQNYALRVSRFVKAIASSDMEYLKH